jgi:hypothetical protein
MKKRKVFQSKCLEEVLEEQEEEHQEEAAEGSIHSTPDHLTML